MPSSAKVTITRSILATIFITLISMSAALPPDFFRNGRGDAHVAGKRSSSSFAESNFLTDVCSFCSVHTAMPEVEQECLANANIRHLCLLAYGTEMEYLAESRNNIPWE